MAKVNPVKYKNYKIITNYSKSFIHYSIALTLKGTLSSVIPREIGSLILNRH